MGSQRKHHIQRIDDRTQVPVQRVKQQRQRSRSRLIRDNQQHSSAREVIKWHQGNQPLADIIVGQDR